MSKVKSQKSKVEYGKTGLMLCVLIFAIMLSGCSLPFGGIDAGEQGQEVALGQECGMDGLKCCENEPSCLYGQTCCSDPNGSARNRCADSCACGGPEEFCCPGEDKCKAGLGCVDGICLVCGAVNEPCCEIRGENARLLACPGDPGADNADNTDLTCHENLCVICGLPGNPCCAGERRCRLQTKPVVAMSECLGGECVACGGDGERACLGGRECNENFLSSNGRCYRCGGVNQPCCRDGQGLDTCPGQKNLTCELGFCKN